jgi:hypothetical protein
MRRLFIFIVLAGFIQIYSFAQSQSDSADYHRGLDLLNSAKTTSNYLSSAEFFDSLATMHPDQWLSFYYSGLSLILAAQESTGLIYRDKLLDKAQVFTDKAVALKPEEPEIHVLQAFLYQGRLQADPQNRAFSLAQKADASIKKAMAADSSNPRAYFLQGYNVYYTPPMFKGGPKNALPVFLKAKEKFGSFTLRLSFMPDWGRQQNEEMINLCKDSKN